MGEPTVTGTETQQPETATCPLQAERVVKRVQLRGDAMAVLVALAAAIPLDANNRQITSKNVSF